MIKTKLILVGGIAGSGKSTIVHYIARQMEKNGIKVKLLFEAVKDHPLDPNLIGEEYDVEKVQFEISKQDWENYRKQILKQLDLVKYEENLYNDLFNRFYGEYQVSDELIKFYEKDNRLCIDAFLPNIKLIPISSNECQMEGFPVTFRFYKHAGKKKIKVIKASAYYKEGTVGKEYNKGGEE